MLMDEGLDTGPVLRQARQQILPTDTTASLAARLAEQGAALLVETLPYGWRGNCHHCHRKSCLASHRSAGRWPRKPV